MKYGTLIGAGLVVAVLAGLIIYSNPNSKKNDQLASPAGSTDQSTGGLVAVTKSDFDFGSIAMKDGVVTTTFPIKNTTDRTIVIDQLYTSCMCTTAQLETAVKNYGPFGMPGHGGRSSLTAALAAGATATIRVAFDPAAHGPAGVGKIDRSVTLATAAGPALTLTIKAVVTP